MTSEVHSCRSARYRHAPCSACLATIEGSAFRRGAAVAFGLMGMAFAIQRRQVETAEIGSDYEVGYWTGFDAKWQQYDHSAPGEVAARTASPNNLHADEVRTSSASGDK